MNSKSAITAAEQLAYWEDAPGAAAPTQRAVVTAAGCALVQSLAAEAVSQASIASALGLPYAAFQGVLQRQPEVRDAYAAGRGEQESRLFSMLMGKAREGNVTAMIFLLKSVHHWRDTGPRSDAPAAPTVAVQINLPAAMDREAWAKATVIEAKPG